MVRAGLRVKGLGNPKGPAKAVEGENTPTYIPHTLTAASKPSPCSYRRTG